VISFLFKKFEVDRSGKWRSTRDKYLKNNPFCIGCGTNNNLRVHHIIPVSVDISKELCINNLCTVCEYCHFVFGHLHNYKNYNPEVIRDCQEHYKRVKQFSVRSSVRPFSLWRTIMSKFFGSIALVFFGYSIYVSHMYIVESNKNATIKELFAAENRLLKDEIYAERSKPTYENGYRDAILRAGPPTGSGTYRDGWEACAKLYADGSWTSGYHTALEQFGWKNESTAFKNSNPQAVSMK
jgi:hypothetical protein